MLELAQQIDRPLDATALMLEDVLTRITQLSDDVQQISNRHSGCFHGTAGRQGINRGMPLRSSGGKPDRRAGVDIIFFSRTQREVTM